MRSPKSLEIPDQMEVEDEKLEDEKNTEEGGLRNGVASVNHLNLNCVQVFKRPPIRPPVMFCDSANFFRLQLPAARNSAEFRIEISNESNSFANIRRPLFPQGGALSATRKHPLFIYTCSSPLLGSGFPSSWLYLTATRTRVLC